MVFQSYAVWPHLTVAENVAFPLTVKGERDVAGGVNWALDIVGMSKLAKRRPSELSGGQQQRVALARAIAARPRLLLFDEPLSNLDARLRDRTRLEISRIQRELKVPALYVTHDQTEALSMSDRIIVMETGRIVQEGTTARPVPAAGQSLRRRFHRQRQFPACATRRPRVAARKRLAGRWSIRPPTATMAVPRSRCSVPRRSGSTKHSAPTVAGQNRLTGHVVGGMYLGPHVEYIVEVGADRLRAYSRSALAPGSPAILTFDARDCRLVDDVAHQTEARLQHAG